MTLLLFNMRKVILVGCGKKKKGGSHKAKDLYEGVLFRKTYDYAKLIGDDIYIISALYGLVNPERIIKNYNDTLHGREDSFVREWSMRVSLEIKKLYPEKEGVEIFIFAGEIYRKYVLYILTQMGYNIRNGFGEEKGFGIGKRLHFLNKNIKNGQSKQKDKK